MKTLLKFKNMTDKEWEDYCYKNEHSLDDYDERTWADNINFEANYSNLEETLSNLNVSDEIVVIADLGLWDGRRIAYKILDKDASSIINDIDYYEYPEIEMNNNNELYATDIHHDGTNYYRFRVWRSGVSEKGKERFLENIYYGEVSEDEIIKYTKALRIPKKVLVA
jgi:hypothetical protein